MKMMMMKIMILISIMTTMLKTPMSMMIMLLIQTMMSIMIMNKNSNCSWFPMITFMMMIGGILIIFMYMSSITSNKKFKTNMSKLWIIMMMTIMTEELMMDYQPMEQQEINQSIEFMPMAKIYNKTMTLTMIMVLYLLLTMISINKIVKNFEGPMRSKTYE